jgi:hypothetical protein
MEIAGGSETVNRRLFVDRVFKLLQYGQPFIWIASHILTPTITYENNH